MTLEQIETRARALLATLPPESDVAQGLDSLVETIEFLTDRQSKDARILQQMVAFLARLEAGISAK